jgi:hypothetical protein
MMFRSCIVDSSPSLNTGGNAVAKSKNATYVGWPSLCRMLGLVLVSYCLYRLVALTILATLTVVLGVPTG